MTAASKAIPLARLKRRALSLGAAKALDYALQFLLPVVLVRCLDAATFGEYRLLWLAVGTLMVLATLNMPQSLYLFLPRSDARLKRLYVSQTLFFLALSGLVCAFLVSPLNPWHPAAMRPLEKYGVLVPAFITLWLVACVLDFLPTVDERIAWQAKAQIGLSLLRVALLAGGAFFTGSMLVLLWLLLGFVLVKLALLAAYIGRFHGLPGGRNGAAFEPRLFADQLRRAIPFGLSSALFGLRGQGDQWIAAHLFSLQSFAAFSIAPLLGSMVNVFRTSVGEAFLPSMSRLQAAGDARGMLDLNSRANVMVATLLFPILAFAFVFAGEIVAFLFTRTYLEAAPVMRFYAVGFAVMVIELGSMILLLDEGKFHLKVNAIAIVLSLALSLVAALHFGLVGAAAGGVCALYFDRAAMLRRVSQRTGVPVRKLQNWRGLGLALAYAVGAALLAWGVTEVHLFGRPPIERLLAGGAVLTGAYAGIWYFMNRKKA